MMKWLRRKFRPTDDDLLGQGKCPDCRAQGTLLQGPTGGAAMNVLCDNCLHEFNIMAWGTFGIYHVESKRGLVTASRAAVFGVTQEEYNAKITADPTA